MSKSATRGGPTHTAKEEKFVEELDELFDISHINALSMITVQEVREFCLRRGVKTAQAA